MAVTIDGTTGVSAVQTGAVTTSDLPAGTVLQVVSVTNATQIISTSTVTVVTASITVAANSRVCAAASIPHYAPGAGTWGSVFGTRLMQNGNEVFNCEHVGTAANGDQTQQVPVLFTTQSLTAGTYVFLVSCSPIIGGTHTYNRDGRASTMTLMEIAA